jgi:formylglycine-generating enzyme required for sulfatase activity
VLKLSKLCLDGDDMTDDQRDALCNMGESLGLTGGEAEDIIDEYLEEMANTPMQPVVISKASPNAARGTPPKLPVRSVAPVATIPAAKPAPPKPAAAKGPTPAVREQTIAPPAEPAINISPMARIQERQKYPNFTNSVGVELMLVTSGHLIMGSDAKDAAPHEQPASPTTVSCFYIGRFPITNGQYEAFDPAHRSRRAPWADEKHPVILVSSKDAMNFCQWLSSKEGRRYRLPTEAEWEYAARGTDGRVFPWGDRLDNGQCANFADRRSNFPWSDPHIDDGYAETAPVGSYPRSASPFGVEDLSGNVFEWCQDYFDFYRGQARLNPKGPNNGTKRIYRGGSWRSRANSLRASARAFNIPDYTANDVGFRIVCECE